MNLWLLERVSREDKGKGRWNLALECGVMKRNVRIRYSYGVTWYDNFNGKFQ